ncbi:hypothetical protein HNR46_001215 [Haloferula luteola]|uniref:Uncharacterized protein n=1 Tax=Haloferula luteola TaxID=595692 RepID=A0A840VDR1_9BACT|nr:hypothetical protein [Haloferula luteola]
MPQLHGSQGIEIRDLEQSGDWLRPFKMIPASQILYHGRSQERVGLQPFRSLTHDALPEGAFLSVPMR